MRETSTTVCIIMARYLFQVAMTPLRVLELQLTATRIGLGMTAAVLEVILAPTRKAVRASAVFLKTLVQSQQKTYRQGAVALMTACRPRACTLGKSIA